MSDEDDQTLLLSVGDEGVFSSGGEEDCFEQSEIEIVQDNQLYSVMVLDTKLGRGVPNTSSKTDRTQTSVKCITSKNGKKNSKKNLKNEQFPSFSKKRRRDQDEEVPQDRTKRRRKRKTHEDNQLMEINSQEEEEEDPISSSSSVVNTQKEGELFLKNPYQIKREGSSMGLIDELKAPSHRLKKEEVQFVKILSTSFNSTMYEQTDAPEAESNNKLSSSPSESLSSDGSDEEEEGDEDGSSSLEQTDSFSNDQPETSLDKLRLSDIHDEKYHQFANTIFRKSEYTFDDISLVSTIDGRPCILLFNSTTSKRFPIYCYRVKQNTRFKILSKFNSAWQATLGRIMHENEMQHNPGIFRPEEKIVPVAKRRTETARDIPKKVITNESLETCLGTDLLYKSDSDNQQQKYETKLVMSEEEKLFYYTTSYRVIEAYHQHTVDQFSKNKMFLDPVYSLKRYPSMCWGFDFSLIFDLLRKSENFSRFADSFDSSKFVSSILSMYPSLEDEEKVILNKIKEMARFKRNRNTKNKSKKEDKVSANEESGVLDNDDVEEIDDFYSFSDSTASVLTDDDDDDDEGEQDKEKNTKYTKRREENQRKHAAKRVVKYWIEIFLPRIDYKDFVKPQNSRSSKKKAGVPKRLKKGSDEQEDAEFDEDLSTEFMESSPPPIEEDDNGDCDENEEDKEIPDSKRLKKPKNSVIYHKDRFIPAVLLPFFIDSLPPKKRINNSATNVTFRLLDCLKKFRNDIVTGGTKGSSSSSQPPPPPFNNTTSYVHFQFGSYINNGGSSNIFNVEVASLDATILQLEVNYEKLLFAIHSRNIELHFVAQSLAYDTRDALNIQTKCIDDHHKKFKRVYTRLSRITKRTDTNRQNIGICLKTTKRIDKLQQEVRQLRKEMTQVKKMKGTNKNKKT